MNAIDSTPENARALCWEAVEPGLSWPSGDAQDVAQLRVTAAQLGTCLGMAPLQGIEEGMGHWIAFGGRVNGVLAELIRYDGEPGSAAFTLRVEAGADAAPLLLALMQVLDLRAAQLAWIHPGVAAHPAVLAALAR